MCSSAGSCSRSLLECQAHFFVLRCAEEPAEGEPVKVWGNLVANVERLDDELFKSLQVRCPIAFIFACLTVDEQLGDTCSGRASHLVPAECNPPGSLVSPLLSCTRASICVAPVLISEIRSVGRPAGHRSAHPQVHAAHAGRAAVPRTGPEGMTPIPYPPFKSLLHRPPANDGLTARPFLLLHGSTPCAWLSDSMGGVYMCRDSLSLPSLRNRHLCDLDEKPVLMVGLRRSAHTWSDRRTGGRWRALPCAESSTCTTRTTWCMTPSAATSYPPRCTQCTVYSFFNFCFSHGSECVLLVQGLLVQGRLPVHRCAVTGSAWWPPADLFCHRRIVMLVAQEAQAAGQVAAEEAEAQDEGADLGDEDEPAEEGAPVSPAQCELNTDFVFRKSYEEGTGSEWLERKRMAYHEGADEKGAGIPVVRREGLHPVLLRQPAHVGMRFHELLLLTQTPLTAANAGRPGGQGGRANPGGLRDGGVAACRH